jgi:hypothetical protein
MVTLNPALLDRVRNLAWFCHVGEPIESPPPLEIVQILTWEEAPIYFHAEEWEDARHEAQNALSSYLSRYHKTEDRQWNKIVVASQEFLKSEVEAKVLPFAQKYKLDKNFYATVRWSLVGTLREDAYGECNPPVRFFTHLLSLYEQGHFPCGWVDGTWPEGKLVVL